MTCKSNVTNNIFYHWTYCKLLQARDYIVMGLSVNDQRNRIYKRNSHRPDFGHWVFFVTFITVAMIGIFSNKHTFCFPKMFALFCTFISKLTFTKCSLLYEKCTVFYFLHNKSNLIINLCEMILVAFKIHLKYTV